MSTENIAMLLVDIIYNDSIHRWTEFTQRRSWDLQHLHQRNTSEPIKQLYLIFEGTIGLRKLLIKQLNRNLTDSVNF